MAIDIPASSSTVSVSIIDTTRMTDMPWNLFLGPRIDGMTSWNCSGYCFLITHDDRRLLFDLSPAKDFKQTLPPPQADLVGSWEKGGTKINVTEDVFEVLARESINLSSGDALLWSHPHWDHMGNTLRFPQDVPLLMGAGVRATYGPGYPEVHDAPWYTKDLAGRKIVDVSFDDAALVINGMKALDYFGDGSFYLLNAPGHCVGHLNGLARVTEDSFIFLGADSYHHGSQIRPNSSEPLPTTLDRATLMACPGDLKALYARKADHQHDPYQEFCNKSVPGESPILTIGWQENGFTVAIQPSAAVETIEKIQAFDMDDRVFCICSHDISLRSTIDVFPKTADNWKQNGWKEKSKWEFLKEFAPYFASNH